MIRNLVMGSGANFLIAFSSLILLARLFPLEFISDVKSITIYGGWFSLVFTCQVHSAFLFYHNRPGSDSVSIQAFTLVFLLGAASLCGLSFFFVFPNLYYPAGIDRTGLVAFSALVGLNLLYAVSPAIMTAKGSSRKLPALMFLYPAMALGALLISWQLSLSVNHYAILAVTLSAAVLITSEWRRYVIFACRNFPLALSGYRHAFGGYSLKISWSIFFESLGSRVDKILASRFFGSAAFAKYSVLCFENPLVSVLLNSYGLVLVKKFQGGISGREEEFLEAWARLVRVVSFMTFPVSIFIFFHHERFISAVFGSRFLEAGGVLKVYLAVSLIRYAPFQALLRLEGAVHYNVIMSMCFFLSSLVAASAVLAVGLGWEFLAASYFSAWLIFNGLALFFFSRVSSISIARILTFDLWFTRTAQCVIAGLLGIITSPSNIYVSLVVSFITYLAIVLYFDPVIRSLVPVRAIAGWRQP